MFKVVLEVSFKPFLSAETAIKAKTAEKSKQIKPIMMPELFKRNSLLTLSIKKVNFTSIPKAYKGSNRPSSNIVKNPIYSLIAKVFDPIGCNRVAKK